jgi:hypothetical protein
LIVRRLHGVTTIFFAAIAVVHRRRARKGRERLSCKDVSGVIAIPQPSHAWLSGHMARPRVPQIACRGGSAKVCLREIIADLNWA